MAAQSKLTTFVTHASASITLPAPASVPASAPAPAPAPASISPSSELSDLASLEDRFDNSSSQSTATSSSSRKRPRPRTGWYFNHMPDEDPETRYYSADDKGQELDKNIVWKCKYCPPHNIKAYKISGGNWKIKEHLLFHGFKDDSPRAERARDQQLSIEQAQQEGESNPQKRRKLSHQPGESINPNTLEVLYVKFVAVLHQPLRLVECPEFRALLFYLNNEIDNWLPNSPTTATEWVKRQYNTQKETQRQKLHSARSDIHLMADLWSAPNHRSIIGVTATYVGEDGKAESVVLAVKTVVGGHDGDNLAKYMVEVIRDWGIASKLGYINLDNASNNKTMVQTMAYGAFLTASFSLLWVRADLYRASTRV
jgi:hypothetical protein